MAIYSNPDALLRRQKEMRDRIEARKEADSMRKKGVTIVRRKTVMTKDT